MSSVADTSFIGQKDSESGWYFEAWLSLVERCVRDAEVASSNLVASILCMGTMLE